jgi:hypothetical protein
MSLSARRAPLPQDSWASALEEAEELAGKGFAEHYAALAAACRLAFTILDGHPERQRLLDAQEPLPADSVALLGRLRRRAGR